MNDLINLPIRDNQLHNYFGCLYGITDSIAVADSVTTTDGVVVTGTVVDTRTINDIYYQVQETGKFKIDFTFVGLTKNPAKVFVKGRYVGNPAHEVKIYVWNYGLSVPDWEALTAELKDFPAAAVDEDFSFDFPDLSGDYISGGECQVRIEHISNATSSHDMYIDRIAVATATVELPIANTPVKIDGFLESAEYNVAIDKANGLMTIKRGGSYVLYGNMSFSGSGNTGIVGHFYKNGVIICNCLGFTRTLTSSGSVGNAGTPIIPQTLKPGDIITFVVSATLDDSFISVSQYGFAAIRIR